MDTDIAVGDSVEIVAYADDNHRDFIGMRGIASWFDSDDVYIPVVLDSVPSSWIVDDRRLFLFLPSEVERV